jgi:hypothetical protein
MIKAKKAAKRTVYANSRGELVVSSRFIADTLLISHEEAVQLITASTASLFGDDQSLFSRHISHTDNATIELSYFAFDEIFGPFVSASTSRLTAAGFNRILDQFHDAETHYESAGQVPQFCTSLK